ncbi:MAG TPA: penicillin acylase family protein, partial [Chloroflexota bacterium]|nr:penicillin acylase family protein [Chloroflexota bacterium]
VAAIQSDVQSARARDLVPALLKTLELTGYDEKSAVAALRVWNCEFALDQAGATVWAAFWGEWCLAVARARFPDRLVTVASARVGAVARRLLSGDRLPWFGDWTTGEHVRRAFTDGVRSLIDVAGPDPADWHWGKLHQVRFQHPLSTTPDLAEIFDVGPFPTSGGNSVVRAAGHNLKAPFSVNSGSTYRLVADLSGPNLLRTVQTLGQSGQPGSSHYRDQSALWLEDAYHPLFMNEDALRGEITSEVVLDPGTK